MCKMAMAMDSEEWIGGGDGKGEWACGATRCREAWKGGFVGMSGFADLGMRAPSVRAWVRTVC